MGNAVPAPVRKSISSLHIPSFRRRSSASVHIQPATDELLREKPFRDDPTSVRESEQRKTDIERKYNAFYEKDRLQQFIQRYDENSCPKGKRENLLVLGCIVTWSNASLYKVQKLPSKEKFLLKVYQKTGLDDGYRRSRVVQEKMIQFAARNEFLLGLDSAFHDSKYVYMLLPFAKYGHLGRFLKEKKALSLRTIKIIAKQMALALEYLNDVHVCHRDISPENIFIFEDGYLKLGEFGCAKVVPDRTFSKIGTTRYMAPEMFGEDGYERQVDMWAFGVVLYEMLCEGRHPFSTRTHEVHVKEDIHFQPLALPAELSKKYPKDYRDIKDLLGGLLEKSAARRFGRVEPGMSGVVFHPFFKDINHKKMTAKDFKLEVFIDEPKASKEGIMGRAGNEKMEPEDLQGYEGF
ncbi:cAMP-dependent protein kinase catalytic subunit 1-like [Galendromus occidentalis]|uniref:cAMP-dependent protein kinase catalytic subunit 1-like n=1 Tax=Galendromus occidentalis TaxID=34638 RepID=A0AAJ6QRB6_9ACAR|nr:cAMP-dependent protein kinase catalytic subunit 1-like [Galendromus occidentalis]